jgi:uncharacterized membrane protein
VLFTMISNHYATTFGGRYNWLVLIALCAAGVLIRVYFVARHKRHERGGKTSLWPALLGLLIVAATAGALAPKRTAPTSATATAEGTAARFADIQGIVANRCAPCHAAAPTQPGFAAAPKGVLLDSTAGLLANLRAIEPQVATRAMPIGNLTCMTETERSQLLDWIRHDAPH